MPDLDLTSLRLFVCVCETGNIARAADRANVVGSAISKRIAHLEDLLGTPLFVRKRHGVAPTPAGQTLLQHARAMVDSAARIEADMRSFAEGVRGHVRILSSVTALANWLAQDVAAFLAQPAHRAIEVAMEERVSPEITRGVREGFADFGVCWDAGDTTGLATRPYRTDRLCVVMPARHPLAGRRRLRFADLLDQDQVCPPVTSALQVRLQREAAALGRTLRPRVIVSNFEGALRIVATGLAISLVPHEVADPLRRLYPIRIAELDEAWAQRHFVVCFRDALLLTPSAQLMLAHMLGRPEA